MCVFVLERIYINSHSLKYFKSSDFMQLHDLTLQFHLCKRTRLYFHLFLFLQEIQRCHSLLDAIIYELQPEVTWQDFSLFSRYSETRMN